MVGLAGIEPASLPYRGSYPPPVLYHLSYKAICPLWRHSSGLRLSCVPPRLSEVPGRSVCYRKFPPVCRWSAKYGAVWPRPPSTEI